MLTLREYQEVARDRIIADWQAGNLNVVLVMATGLGKTETFLATLAAERSRALAAGEPFRACVIGHREELVFQPADRIAKHWNGFLPQPGIIMGAKHRDYRSELVVSTVQTLSGRRQRAKIPIETTVDDWGEDVEIFMPGPHHLRAMKRAIRDGGPFTHLVIDECHHAVADTYRRVVRFLRRANPKLRHLGVTATPKRADEEGLITVYDKVSFRIGLREAIEVYGALVPFIGYGFVLPVSLKGVKVIGDDYSAGDVARLLTANNIEEIIIQHWVEKASDRQTMVFTATVEQAHSLAGAFRRHGYAAEAADGKSPRPERRAILRRYLAGETQILVNCALWTEGVDAPPTSAIVMACMTRSDVKYMQCLGRGLRRWPGKDDCVVLDFAPLDERDVLMAGDILGVPAENRKRVKLAEEEGTVLDVFGMAHQQELGIDAPADKVQIKALDFFGKARLQWTHDGRLATVGVNSGLTVAVVFPQDDRAEVAEQLRGGPGWTPAMERAYRRVTRFQVFAIDRANGLTDLGAFDDWDSAAATANDIAEKKANPVLANKAQAWRNQPASPDQIKLATRLGTYKEGMNRGQVAQAITHGLAIKKLRDKGIVRWDS